MPVWHIVFFPAPGNRNSPYDYIKGLSDKSDQARIYNRLETMSKMERGEWPHTWIHKMQDDIFQLTAGNQRVMYFLDNGTIIVCHACRKVKGKTLKKDIKRAIAHYNEYFATKKG